MKQIALLLFFISFSLFAQNRKGSLQLTSSNSHILYAAFSPSIHFDSKNYNAEIIKLIPEIEPLITEYQIQFEKAIQIQEKKLIQLSEEASHISKSNASIKKLQNILKVKTNSLTNQRIAILANKLEAFDLIEYCSLISQTPIAPPTDIPPTTNNYESNQTYFGPNPGVNMHYAHTLGLTGNGIRVRDIEYGFNKNHEDLNETTSSIASGMTIHPDAIPYTQHGTAVVSIINAHKGTYGTTGMAYNANEVVLFPEWQESGYDRINAITQAIANSQAGDVIIFEMQAYGQNNNYVPAEFENIVWDLTKAATDAGIIIVAAAGNGGQNLDSGYYSSYMARGNSGAIIVGGGKADLTHNRISYSTYGTRVDVQGWSENVFACGYGNIIKVGNDINQGYTYFEGTSAATPIVAGCTVVLQSYYHGLTSSYMTSSKMRQLLKNTGIPQGNGVSGNIGPLPNMQSAIQQINATLSTIDDSKLVFSLFPNPAKNNFTVTLPDTFSKEASLEMYDNLGRRLFFKSDFSQETTIDITNLPLGMYFVKVVMNNKTAVKKIMKK